MSKVYSFRLDENNPRESQAMRVIEAWVEEGYSLRHQLVDVLISFQKQTSQDKQYSDLLEKIEFLIASPQEEKEIATNRRGAFTEIFLESISKTIKGGIKIE